MMAIFSTLSTERILIKSKEMDVIDGLNLF